MTPEQKSETEFCVFADAAHGFRALATLLRTYQTKHGLDTPAQICTDYSPGLHAGLFIDQLKGITMVGMSDYTAKKVLDHIVGKTAMGTLPTGYIALFTAVGADDGTGFTEVSGGSYARKSTAGTDWNAASGSSPSSNSNANALAFPTPTADWGTVIAFGIYDASTAGNLLAWDYLGNYAWLPCEISSAAPGVITAKAHGFSAADKVVFTTEFGGTAPSFSQSNLTGQLAVVSPSTDTFTVTNGGTAVNTSSTGSGMIRKIAPQSIPTGVVATFAGGTPGTLVLQAA